MPVRIVVRLTPEHPRATPPPHNAPAVNAAFLKAISEFDPALAKALHDGPKYKPFTLTPLLGDHDTTPTTPGTAARFEIALLTDGLTGPILGALTEQDSYQIGTAHYRSAGVALDAVMPYEALAGAASPRTQWSFRLVTPVSFATAAGDGVRRQRPWPDAVRVFTNLADRWDTFAGPVALPESARAVINNHLETSGGDLRIVDHLVKTPNIYRRGARGTVEYRIAEPKTAPTEAIHAVDALATFAEYAGFGDRTAVGMGHVRLR